MNRRVQQTLDGSNTLFISALNESYHSQHGALQEAQHVFINNGLKRIEKCEINILELGFGTGLNFLATIDEFFKNDKYHVINYYAIEKYPVTPDEISCLNYEKLFPDKKISEAYMTAHQSEWNREIELTSGFTLTKLRADFHQLNEIDLPPIDLVYFDCFGARVQPDLWQKPLLEKLDQKTAPSSLLTTYASKGSFRRELQSLNFSVEKMAGPPGKREMLNAWKMPKQT